MGLPKKVLSKEIFRALEEDEEMALEEDENMDWD